MTLVQNGDLRYGNFSDYLGIPDNMANLGMIDFKIRLLIKVYVNIGQKKCGVHISKKLAKMDINWHKIGQIPRFLLLRQIEW